MGQLSSLQVEAYLKEAKCIVIPSICYENFPRTIAEAFSCGVPVIASRLGSMAKILDDGKTGLLFSVGDAKDLANKVRMIFNNETLIEQMRVACRRKFCQNYTADKNYQVLKDIYQKLTDCKIGV